MKKIISLILVLVLTLCFAAGCSKNDTASTVESVNDIVSELPQDDNTQSSVIDNSSLPQQSTEQFTSSDNIQTENTNTANNQLENKIKKENVKINSLDKLNFYAVKKAIAENDIELLSSSHKNSVTNLLLNNNNSLNLLKLNKTTIDPNADFTITMYSYFTVNLTDTNGFLAQKLGGTGSVEVVITRNNFNDMITFRKGERYYSCLKTTSTDKAMSFSTHKYIDGFQMVENADAENYEFVVYFEGDRVVGISCDRYNEGSNYRYSADTIKFNDNFSFVVYKKQSFSMKKLEQLFASNNLFVDDGVVLSDGSVLFAKATIMDETVSLKTVPGITLNKKDITNVSALYNSKYGYCIKLDLVKPDLITGKIMCNIFINGSKDRELTLQKDGSNVYIIDLNAKNRMSDVYYKLIAINNSNKINKIISYNDLKTEMSKRINFEDYNATGSVDSRVYNTVTEYTYTLKHEKSISYKESNYEVTIDDITFTLPIRVKDLMDKGFTIGDRDFYPDVMQGGPDLVSPKGNTTLSFVMDFYGDATSFYDCYVTQLLFSCYETNGNQNGINTNLPEFDILEGINRYSSIDDVVYRLGEPNEFNIAAIDNDYPFYDWCIIQLHYKIVTPSLPNGSIWFTFISNERIDGPERLEAVSYSLQ